MGARPSAPESPSPSLICLRTGHPHPSLGATQAGARTTALLKAEQLEVVRVVLAAGATMGRYTSIALASRCKKMGVRPSMETWTMPYDNAMAESLFTSLECELINRRSWRSQAQAPWTSARTQGPESGRKQMQEPA